MRNDGKDILTESAELKKMPFRVPDNYFDGVGKSVRSRLAARRPLKTSLTRRILPYVSAAAVLAVVMTGAILIRMENRYSLLKEMDSFYRTADLIPVTDPASIYFSSYEEDSDGLSEEDIINYLVYTGVEPEEFDNR